MSTILLTNPFAPLQPPSNSGGQAPAGAETSPPSGTAPTAVQPFTQSGTDNQSGSPTSYSGTGAGAGGAAAQQKPAGKSGLVTPTDADPSSVVSAQVAEQAEAEQDVFSQTAISRMEARRDAASVKDGTSEDAEPEPPLELPKSETARELPDPLPTSPFLKRNETAA
ncbi:hypothetical protein Z945_2944 [Sulfitobacter noctilucae]|uniref:hypothetical protein n=1 Tax=Sulfitobacter noctilucae TaxID=1342302 RepID=UPI00046855E4|nr:hypothetical protein [Sulfitobacter noctilucae]KIN75045.1 hypothetical protein Z945_2944 [Sulfitobacter noctilucae]